MPCRKLQTAHAKLSKLQKEQEAQESERGSASEKPPESVRDVAASAKVAEGPSSSMPLTTTAAAEPSRDDEDQAACVSGRPFLSLSAMQKYAGVAKVQQGDA